MKTGIVRAGWDAIRRTLYGSVAVAAATVLAVQFHLGAPGAIPVFLLVVVLHSLAGNFLSAAFICILSVLSLDYYFTVPVLSWRISKPADALALLGFAITSLIITRLVTRIRAEARFASHQKDRFDRLYQLSQQLLALEQEDLASAKFLEPFRRLFSVNAICTFDAESLGLNFAGDSAFGLAEKTRNAFIQNREFTDSDSRVAVRCVRLGGKLTGAIGFEGLRHPEQTADALTALTAALLARVKAFQKASAASAAAQTEMYRSVVLDALAHEFKTPLATILAAAGGMRESGPLTPEQSEMADTVENEAARLGKLTSRLLRTARLDREEIKPRLEWIDLATLTERVAGQYSARSSDREIRVTTHGRMDAFVDPELLQLTMGQLIENACKYSQPGSTVTIGMEQLGDFVNLRISNTGSSIPVPEQHHIFERFYRGTDAKRSTAGSGLGLYVARKIALAHGGALELEPQEPSQNCVTFSLNLPRTKEAAEHAFAK